jgi:hypothetical protein
VLGSADRICAAGLAVLVALATFGCELQTSAREVQLRSLVQSPQQYQEKVLIVHGFLYLGREGDAPRANVR